MEYSPDKVEIEEIEKILEKSKYYIETDDKIEIESNDSNLIGKTGEMFGKTVEIVKAAGRDELCVQISSKKSIYVDEIKISSKEEVEEFAPTHIQMISVNRDNRVVIGVYISKEWVEVDIMAFSSEDLMDYYLSKLKRWG